jgi:hypothetical protein
MYKWMIPLLFCACGVQTLDTGNQVSVSIRLIGDAAALSVEAVELRACDAAAPTRSFAHTASSPTRSGEPHVVNAGAAQTLATLEPAPGRYCALILVIGPADSDAVNVDENMVGQSVRVGQTKIAGSTSVVTLLQPLELEKVKSVTLQVDFDTSLWLNGVDTTQLASDTERSKLYANISASASLKP